MKTQFGLFATLGFVSATTFALTTSVIFISLYLNYLA